MCHVPFQADALSGGKALLPITMKHDDKRVLVCGWRAKWSQSTKVRGATTNNRARARHPTTARKNARTHAASPSHHRDPRNAKPDPPPSTVARKRQR